ncbi:MAG: GMC family oxidoreductase [Pseudotabrizicola sp.]|uniref:GMC oxidoreductase n=1 Tax=Pseudotabrizicola sp. TaxID=2939647 RepID=UPI0027321C28|nr:GMC family oxidoreductase [Pseudotabrizicola sp.]MDP2081517.1 GMC family oxidoreductase [Pseudotabrizicola sp.]MDZ7575720.1 GMC family oxidoreductase [Pseudotabrizicola sp.]
MKTITADIAIIGSGVGGSSVAHQLAGSGAKILILERGDFLPNEPQNSDAEAVFVQSRYKTREEWQDAKGALYRPGQYYYVGGHTKFYGTAMFRFRPRDFVSTMIDGAASPSWPISYDDLAPHYAKAERLYGVRGHSGLDPTEPPRAGFPHAAIPHEPVIAALADRLRGLGLHPFPMPSAVDYGPGGACQRCGTCDAFACRYDAKGDADTRVLRPLLTHPDVRLERNAEVTRLIVDDRGQRIIAAEVQRGGAMFRVEAPLFVLSAGAINSALILLRSACEAAPEGLANRSGVVGRYLMNHHLTGMMGISPFATNDTKFPKTLSVNDFYHGLPGDADARGNVQMLGNIQGPMIRSTYPAMPRALANWLGRHSVDVLAMSEDLPNPDSRVRLTSGGQVVVDYRPGGTAAHDRFVRHVRGILRRAGFAAVLRHSFGIQAPSHQCGTVRMGNDPASSALDGMCRAHDHPNLYVVDAGFFPSSAALNPALTIAAQALRVGAHLHNTRGQDAGAAV